MKIPFSAVLLFLAFVGHAAAQTVIYDENFSAGPGTWRATYSSTPDGNTVQNYPLGARTDDGGSVASCCVYWNDNNHNAYGVGKIGLLAWTYAGEMGLGSYADWEGVTVTLRIRAAAGFYMPRYAPMVWWMQRSDPASGKEFNMAFIGKTLDRAMGFGDAAGRANTRMMETDWVDVEFVLSDDWADWICYGAAPTKPHYGCPKSPSQFLSAPMVNMGIHIISWDNAPVLNIGGEFRISRIKIETP